MYEYLERFWNWAEMTPGEYAERSTDLSEMKTPFYYPDYSLLLEYTKNVISQPNLSDEELDDLLTILALDNEAEDVLDTLVTSLPENKLEQVVSHGIRHLQPEARWQIAELVFRRKPTGYTDYLKVLSQDRNAYVRKRAENLLSEK